MIINPKSEQKNNSAQIKRQTPAELATLTKISQYNIQNNLNGDEEKLRNDGICKYFIFEVGLLLKYNTETFICKRLDFDTMSWVPSQDSVSLLYDTTWDFRELTDFQDYYPDSEPKLSNGMQL